MRKFGRLPALALAAALFALALPAQADGPAPDFTLQSRDGASVSLSELRGEVVLINFWASWCGPCRQEMPLLEALYQRYAALGFTMLGVNTDEDPANAEQMLADHPVSFPILYDSGNEVTRLYDVIAMPSTVLVDRTGNIRYLHKGYKPGYENHYQDQIRALIRE